MAFRVVGTTAAIFTSYTATAAKDDRGLRKLSKVLQRSIFIIIVEPQRKEKRPLLPYLEA